MWLGVALLRRLLCLRHVPGFDAGSRDVGYPTPISKASHFNYPPTTTPAPFPVGRGWSCMPVSTPKEAGTHTPAGTRSAPIGVRYWRAVTSWGFLNPVCHPGSHDSLKTRMQEGPEGTRERQALV